MSNSLWEKDAPKLAESKIEFAMNEAKDKKPDTSHQFSSVQSLSHVWLFEAPWTAAHAQASPSITNSQGLTHLMHFIKAELWVLDMWRVSQALFSDPGKGQYSWCVTSFVDVGDRAQTKQRPCPIFRSGHGGGAGKVDRQHVKKQGNTLCISV